MSAWAMFNILDASTISFAAIASAAATLIFFVL